MMEKKLKLKLYWTQLKIKCYSYFYYFTKYNYQSISSNNSNNSNHSNHFLSQNINHNKPDIDNFVNSFAFRIISFKDTLKNIDNLTTANLTTANLTTANFVTLENKKV